MSINPGIKVEKTEIINKLLKELNHFVEELEQQVREDLHGFKQGIKTDDTPGMGIEHLQAMSAAEHDR
jgi:phage-related protein